VQEGPEIKGMAPGEMIYEGPPRKSVRRMKDWSVQPLHGPDGSPVPARILFDSNFKLYWRQLARISALPRSFSPGRFEPEIDAGEQTDQ